MRRGAAQSPDFRAKLVTLDAQCADALRRGDIALLSMYELLKRKPEAIGRRQDLEAMPGPSLFVPPRHAAQLLRAEKRHVLMLSYGWGAPGTPDPTGEVLRHVLRFLEWLRDEYSLSEKEQRNFGVFWDYPSLHQRPRTDAQDVQFKRALRVMAFLYASPLGSCVLQHRGMPQRPAALEGVVLVRDLKDGTVGEESAVRAALADSSLQSVERGTDNGGGQANGWRLRFASHEEAERALVAAVSPWATENGGWAAMGYNDRAYANRGWCVLEDAVTREAVGRAHQLGFEAIRELVEAAPLSKLYDISDADSAAVLVPIKTPQQPKAVLDAIEAATFTSGADKPMVSGMYTDWREKVFRVLDAEGRYVLYDDNRVANMEDEWQRLGGNGCSPRSLACCPRA